MPSKNRKIRLIIVAEIPATLRSGKCFWVLVGCALESPVLGLSDAQTNEALSELARLKLFWHKRRRSYISARAEQRRQKRRYTAHIPQILSLSDFWSSKWVIYLSLTQLSSLSSEKTLKNTDFSNFVSEPTWGFDMGLRAQRIQKIYFPAGYRITYIGRKIYFSDSMDPGDTFCILDHLHNSFCDDFEIYLWYSQIVLKPTRRDWPLGAGSRVWTVPLK